LGGLCKGLLFLRISCDPDYLPKYFMFLCLFVCLGWITKASSLAWLLNLVALITSQPSGPDYSQPSRPDYSQPSGPAYLPKYFMLYCRRVIVGCEQRLAFSQGLRKFSCDPDQLPKLPYLLQEGVRELYIGLLFPEDRGVCC